jgi:hypothetical protein
MELDKTEAWLSFPNSSKSQYCDSAFSEECHLRLHVITFLFWICSFLSYKCQQRCCRSSKAVWIKVQIQKKVNIQHFCSCFTVIMGSWSITRRWKPGSNPGDLKWDLFRTKWYWSRFFSEFFNYPLLIIIHPFFLYINHRPMRCATALNIQHSFFNGIYIALMV